MNRILFGLAMWSAAWVCFGQEAALTLGDAGAPRMEIVLPDQPTAPERTAATELKSYLDRITGGDFKIRSESEAGNGLSGIFVGATERLADAFPVPILSDLPEDTVTVRTAGGDLFLAGSGSRGTIYAVDEFLENHCGVRWYTPEFEVVPADPDLQLSVVDTVFTPPMDYREPCLIGLNALDTRYYNVDQIRRFAVRMKSNGFLVPGDPAWGDQDKCLPGAWLEFRKLVNPDVYFKDHPEWFAEIDGVRVPKQLCLSNPEMLKTMTANLIGMIDATPGVKHVSITQNDTGKDDYCHCPECMKILAEEGTQSGILLRCVNQVAEEVEKKYPDLYVNMLAYHYALAFPEKTRPRRNVSIQVCCPSETVRFDSGSSVNALDGNDNPENRDFYTTLRRWGDSTSKLYAWTYQISFGDVLLPIPNTFNLGPNIRIMAENNVRGVFAQGNAYAPIGDFVELKAWLTAKMLWNPYADDSALIDEFLAAYYGKAAPKMMEYLKLLDADYSPERFRGHNAYASPPELKTWMTLDAMNQATRIFAEAEQLVADDPASLEHLKRVKMCVEFQWLCGYDDYKAEAEKRGCEFLGPESKRAGFDRFIHDCQARNVWRLCEGNGSLNILNQALFQQP